MFIGNGFGKLAGYTQIKELGNLETPIILTNTLAVPVASQALIEYTLNRPENKEVRSVNPVVGETNDGFLNDIRSQSVQISDVLAAIQTAKTGEVLQGNVGAGTGTVCSNYSHQSYQDQSNRYELVQFVLLVYCLQFRCSRSPS